MSGADWKQYFWRNTATNYARTVLRLVSGLVLFRLTYQHLGREEFGFYSLLWSLFGYTILLDFGLGFTAQKAVAQGTASGQTGELNKLIATIFWSFAFLGAVLVAVFALGQPWFLRWTHVSPQNLATFGTAYTIFFAAMALAFPLGIFPEMLRGLQRLDLANWAAIASQIANLGLLTWALLTHASFPVIVFISVATTVAPNLAALVMVWKRIPGLSLHPRHFRFSAVQGVLSFSIVAYLITFTNLVMSRTDQAIISFALGVGAIALYQAGYKAAEMFGLFSVQMQDALTPAAAQLHARRDEAGLRDLLLRSMQLTLLLCLPLYAVCAVYLEPLVRVLTGLPSLEPQTWAVGQALLLATCSSLVTNSCAKRVMMMCGWERKLLKLSLADAGCNLVASLLLVKPLGVLGIALGTMVPTVLIGWLWMTPLTARFMNTSVWSLIASVVRPIALPVGAALLVLGALAWFAPLSPGAGFAGCVWRGAVVAIVQLALGWPILKRLRASG